jgi:hypothetical protein
MKLIYLVTDGDYGIVATFELKETCDTWVNSSNFRYGATIEVSTFNEGSEQLALYDYREACK